LSIFAALNPELKTGKSELSGFHIVLQAARGLTEIKLAFISHQIF